MSVTAKSEKVIISPDDAYHRSYILEKKIAIVGPSNQFTTENVNLIIGTFSNTIIYGREAKRRRPYKEVEGFPDAAREFSFRVKQIASQVILNYKAAQRKTGLYAYIL